MPTNNLVVHTRRTPISGVFRIDPEDAISYLPEYLRKTGRRGRRRTTPNASFYAKHAPITLDLGIVSTSPENRVSRVEVANRSGDITVKLAPKRIYLDVCSRKGNVVVFLPRNFAGKLKLRSRHGQLIFLPALSRIMRLAKMRDRDALVFVGQAADQIDDGTPKSTDACELYSRSGDIVVGLSGEDTYKREETNFWKKLGGYLRGDVSVEHSA
ncbi:hypothetical protein NEOLEDRAFT_72333 [Neolentinus lepideus HHB14362 ss-1]|uniref:DUF7330 domain-containing protein n=1 Tax=Neolentinus lepideus HHB14362 ss-1 TaxID=1314782 RepID=A0A165UC74_9AGAM|nr:hypothetical protein NEOLEDRAFT_72333 [Neolentinus lepideus HHB14362 ss-1]